MSKSTASNIQLLKLPSKMKKRFFDNQNSLKSEVSRQHSESNLTKQTTPTVPTANFLFLPVSVVAYAQSRILIDDFSRLFLSEGDYLSRKKQERRICHPTEEKET
jgi:hypothetical protein